MPRSSNAEKMEVWAEAIQWLISEKNKLDIPCYEQGNIPPSLQGYMHQNLMQTWRPDLLSAILPTVTTTTVKSMLTKTQAFINFFYTLHEYSPKLFCAINALLSRGL